MLERVALFPDLNAQEIAELKAVCRERAVPQAYHSDESALDSLGLY